jgi:hypothetical protein
MRPFVNGKTTTETKAGGTKMISINVNKICFAGAIASAAAAVLLASGCSVAGAGLHRAAEVRIATTLEGASPKLIVAGPARLLHVDVHGRQELSLYSVKRAADGSFNCASVAASGALPLRHGASNDLNLVVPADEAVCLANGSGIARNTDVSWHARRGKDAPVEVAHTDHESPL